MPKIASMSPIVLCAGVLVVMSVALAAEEPPKAGETAPATPSGPPKGFECSDKPLSGTGPGFKSSQDESEETAKKDWLEKAKAVYPDAAWNTAKDPVMECVKQGLYSKCFATGVPCHPKTQ